MFNLFNRRKQGRRNTTCRNKRRRMLLEMLENRQMMAGDVVVNWSNEAITIEGTEQADVITIAEVTVNNQRRLSVNGNHNILFSEGERSIPQRALRDLKSITVHGRGGDDVIVNNTKIAMTMHGDDGNDTIVGGDGHDVIYGGLGEDTIEGGAGDDRIYGDFDSSAAVDGNYGQVIGVGDFDGDRDDDLLFRDAVGKLVIWRMQDGRAVDTKSLTHDSRDRFLGIGDFDGDGDVDLIFERVSNNADKGLLITYVMQGGELRDTRANRVADGYMLGTFVGVGDFDGDGRDGMLTRDGNLLVEYMMDSRGVPVNRSGRMRLDSNETVLGIGKLDGDRREDLLTLRESDDRLILYVDRLSRTVGAGYKNIQDKFLGIGDFVAGNGRHEILMVRNDGRYIEYVTNSQGKVIDIRGAGVGLNPAQNSFQLVGNFNGDDFADVLVRESSGRMVTQIFGYGASTNGLTYADVVDGREAGFAVQTVGNNDDLNGGTGRDLIFGGLGRDFLRGHAEEDNIINHGTFDDFGDGAPSTANGGYRGRIDGNIHVVQNSDGLLRIDGSNGNDVIIVTRSNGRIFIPGAGYFGAEYQNVEIRGLGGDDILVSTLDSIRQGSSAGVALSGNGGFDTLIGGGGDDRFFGRLDGDVFVGGLGIDTVDYSDSLKGVYVTLPENLARSGSDDDRVFQVENVIGSDFDDVILGDGNANRIEGRHGNDRIDGNAGDDVLIGGAGDDHLNGGNGIDTVSYANAPRGINVDLQLSRATGDGTDTVQNTENVIGSEYADRIFGNNLENRLEGLGGDDLLVARGGRDTVLGGAGNDDIQGGIGEDIIDGGPGVEKLAIFVNGFTGCCISNLSITGTIQPLFDYISILPGMNVQQADWNNIHGGSNPSNLLDNDDRFVGDLVNVLNMYGDEDIIVLMGHSFGGDAVLDAARRTSRQIDLLAVIDPIDGGGTRSGWSGTDVFANVGYFYNRWQSDSSQLVAPEEYLLPLFFSGKLDSKANVSDQAKREYFRDAGGNILSTAPISHSWMPYDDLIQTELKSIIANILRDSQGVLRS